MNYREKHALAMMLTWIFLATLFPSDNTLTVLWRVFAFAVTLAVFVYTPKGK